MSIKTAPMDPEDVFPRMSPAALWRAAVRALLYFVIALPLACAAVGAVLDGVPPDGGIITAVLVPAFFGAVFGAIPMAVTFLLATLIQRALNRIPERGAHRLAAGLLGGLVAGGLIALLLPGDWSSRLAFAAVVGLVAGGSAAAAWEVTRRHLDGDIARFGVRQPTPEGAL